MSVVCGKTLKQLQLAGDSDPWLEFYPELSLLSCSRVIVSKGLEDTAHLRKSIQMPGGTHSSSSSSSHAVLEMKCC